MRASSGLETIRVSLLRWGTPAAYVRRLVGELAEHREDLIDDLLRQGFTVTTAEREADRRMGEPTAVARDAFTRLRLGSVAGRHRTISLIVLPAVSLLAAWAIVLAAAALLVGMLSPAFRVGTTSPRGRAVLAVACGLCGYAVPAVAGAAYYVFGRRRCCGRYWSWAPCLLLSAMSSILFVRVFLDGGGTGAGRLVAGATMTPDWPKLLPPLGVLLLLELYCRLRRDVMLDEGHQSGLAAGGGLLAKGRSA